MNVFGFVHPSRRSISYTCTVVDPAPPPPNSPCPCQGHRKGIFKGGRSKKKVLIARSCTITLYYRTTNYLPPHVDRGSVPVYANDWRGGASYAGYPPFPTPLGAVPSLGVPTPMSSFFSFSFFSEIIIGVTPRSS